MEEATEESMPEDYTAAEPPPAAAPTTTMTTTLDGDKKITKKIEEFVFPSCFLVNHDTNSKADNKRKRRALHALTVKMNIEKK